MSLRSSQGNDYTSVLILSAQRVKDVYRELDLQQVYWQYEEDSYQRLMGVIEANAGSLPRGMFLEFADRIYQRKN